MKTISYLSLSLILFTANPAFTEEKPPWSARIQTVLDTAEPLQYERGNRQPLYLWPAMDPGDLTDSEAEYLVRELDRRGIGLIGSWSKDSRAESLARALPIARAQKKLGVPVNINANACMQSFFFDDASTAHVDERGNAFFDDSFDGYIMGCPFAIDHRRDVVREQMTWYLDAYKREGIGIDFIFADWEIDGPHEFNRAHEASLKCQRCRANIDNIDDFASFQKVLREKRSALQKDVYADPVLARFPDALVGNYAEYPNNGLRYWYDFFEYYVDGQPYEADQGAKYRKWYDSFAGTGYTFAMPVVYAWARLFSWYDFDSSDYRWFYNMLKVAGNAGEHTPPDIPIISFVHHLPIDTQKYPHPEMKPMSDKVYKDLLWHMLFRGTDAFFMWCGQAEDAEEIAPLHQVYSEALRYREFLDKGTPISYDVPESPGTVISGLSLGNRIIVRRTDFGGSSGPVNIVVEGKEVVIHVSEGKCEIVDY